MQAASPVDRLAHASSTQTTAQECSQEAVLQISYAQRNFHTALSEKHVGMPPPSPRCIIQEPPCEGRVVPDWFSVFLRSKSRTALCETIHHTRVPYLHLRSASMPGWIICYGIMPRHAHLFGFFFYTAVPNNYLPPPVELQQSDRAICCALTPPSQHRPECLECTTHQQHCTLLIHMHNPYASQLDGVDCGLWLPRGISSAPPPLIVDQPAWRQHTMSIASCSTPRVCPAPSGAFPLSMPQKSSTRRRTAAMPACAYLIPHAMQQHLAQPPPEFPSTNRPAHPHGRPQCLHYVHCTPASAPSSPLQS